jgi:hypothetical protein
VLRVATEYDLYLNMRKFDVFTESELLEVKVPPVFLVTAWFSPHREGYYFFSSSVES